MTDRNRSSEPPAIGPKYWAFISYSHTEEAWASWAQRAIEGFKVPRALVGKPTSAGTVPRRLFPIFRDREELASSADLSADIEQALKDSRSLVVICSPNAAASRWVNAEVTAFRQLCHDRRILCLVVDGEPNARAASGLAEAFPPALRSGERHREDSVFVDAMPLAADARKNRDGKHGAKLKIVAGMLGVGLDELRRRDRRRRFWRAAWALQGAAAVAAVIGWVWWDRQQAVETTQLARSVAQ